MFDIGNPLTIQPVSGQYEIELLIADDKLTDPFRKKVASLEITFSKSLDKPRLSDLHYEPKQEIIFKLGQDRVDPPSSFTAFVVLLIVLSFVGFVYSLTNLKMNLRLFPREGLGSLLNIVFLVMMGAIVWVLIKFWASWTFLETVRVLGMMGILCVTQSFLQSSWVTTPSSASRSDMIHSQIIQRHHRWWVEASPQHHLYQLHDYQEQNHTSNEVDDIGVGNWALGTLLLLYALGFLFDLFNLRFFRGTVSLTPRIQASNAVGHKPDGLGEVVLDFRHALVL